VTVTPTSKNARSDLSEQRDITVKCITPALNLPDGQFRYLTLESVAQTAQRGPPHEGS